MEITDSFYIEDAGLCEKSMDSLLNFFESEGISFDPSVSDKIFRDNQSQIRTLPLNVSTIRRDFALCEIILRTKEDDFKIMLSNQYKWPPRDLSGRPSGIAARFVYIGKKQDEGREMIKSARTKLRDFYRR